jgi:urease accessory protein
MSTTARLLQQRSVGHVHVRMEKDGIAVLREAGSAKCRVPRGSTEGILINTSGGLAGGDVVTIKAEVGTGAALTLTSQAAERVYRTLGPPADVQVHLSVGVGGTLLWLPQESIFYEGSALHRSLQVEIETGARFLAVESMVFGRREMGEAVQRVSVFDRWNIRQGGHLIHAEATRIGPAWPQSKASFGDNHAAATLVLVSPEAEASLDKVQQVLGPEDGVSAWNGKLVARLLAKDGFHLRKTLVQVLVACLGRNKLPKCWSF